MSTNIDLLQSGLPLMPWQRTCFDFPEVAIILWLVRKLSYSVWSWSQTLRSFAQAPLCVLRGLSKIRLSPMSHLPEKSSPSSAMTLNRSSWRGKWRSDSTKATDRVASCSGRNVSWIHLSRREVKLLLLSSWGQIEVSSKTSTWEYYPCLCRILLRV
jgi:hypothetical protein